MNNKEKVYRINFLILTVCALFFISCRSLKPHNKDPYQPTQIKYRVAERVIELKDSLKSQGVDSIFVLSKSCDICYFTPYIPSNNELKKGIEYTSYYYSQPAYIFWLQNGHYFVKKVNEFQNFSPIQRPADKQLVLYDFLSINKDAFTTEDFIFERYDTLIAPIKNSRNENIQIRAIPVVYYEPEAAAVNFREPKSTSFAISYFISDNEFHRSLNLAYFDPIAPVDYERTYKTEQSLDTVIIGNDQVNYQMNHQMKVYQFRNLIQNELFDIEMLDLWDINNKKNE